MKKFLILSLSIAQSLTLFADIVTLEQAREKAISFVMSKTNCEKPSLVQVVEETASDDELPPYYIFNLADSKGFVIVSAESNTLDILAYSLDETFDVGHIDKGARLFLNQYKQDVQKARAGLLTATERAYVSHAKKQATSVEKLLETAQFSQYDGYWFEQYTPVEEAPAGCAATAATIIMHYHQWPARGKGQISYRIDEIGLELSRDFSQDTYNWECIPKERCRDGNWSEEAKHEAPKIQLACGIAAKMAYAPGGSLATALNMLKGMVNHFYYSPDYNKYIYNTSGPEVIREAVVNSINNNCPVLVSGTSSIHVAGHVFVLDGYNSDYYHFNLGWEGTDSGWYSTSGISHEDLSLVVYYTNITPDFSASISNPYFPTSADGFPYPIYQNGGEVTVGALADGDVITAYAVDGTEVTRVTAAGSSAILNLASQTGRVVVISVAGRSVKIVVK